MDQTISGPSYISIIVLPIYDKSMVYYRMSVPMGKDIPDILIITNVNYEKHFRNLLNYRFQFGAHSLYNIEEADGYR